MGQRRTTRSQTVPVLLPGTAPSPTAPSVRRSKSPLAVYPIDFELAIFNRSLSMGTIFYRFWLYIGVDGLPGLPQMI